MFASVYAVIDIAMWSAAIAAGVVVTALVISGGVTYGRWRRRRDKWAYISREEDLPWEELLGLLESRGRARAAAGMPPEQMTEEVLDQLVSMLPSVADARPVELPEDREFKVAHENERRSGRRRWGNPTEINMRSYLWKGDLYGLVVNRSTGGLGIYTDKEVPPGTPLRIRAIEAPANIPMARAEVRHCRKIGRGYFLGCEFSDDIPWNVRVWFG
jgi:hypothetical protein